MKEKAENNSWKATETFTQAARGVSCTFRKSVFPHAFFISVT